MKRKKRPAIKFLAGLFVLAFFVPLLFSYWSYYTNDELVQYIPKDVLAVAQVKVALPFQKNVGLDDPSLNSLYEYIDAELRWSLHFKDDVVPNINKQFVFAVLQDTVHSKVLIMKSKHIDELKNHFSQYSHFVIENDIFAVRISGNKDFVFEPRNEFSYPLPGYHFLKFYVDVPYALGLIKTNAPQVNMAIDTLVSMNTKLVHEKYVYITADKDGANFRFSVHDLNENTERNNITRTNSGNRRTVLPNDFGLSFIGINTKDILSYSLGSKSPLVSELKNEIQNIFENSVDLFIQDDSFVAVLNAHTEKEQKDIQQVLKKFISVTLPLKLPKVFPDNTEGSEIIAKDYNDIDFFSEDSDPIVYLYQDEEQEFAYSLSGQTVFVSDSHQTLIMYFEQVENSALFQKLKSCWSVMPSTYLLLNIMGDDTMIALKYDNSVVTGCIY